MRFSKGVGNCWTVLGDLLYFYTKNILTTRAAFRTLKVRDFPFIKEYSLGCMWHKLDFSLGKIKNY